MSATIADQYRGFAITYPATDKADSHDLIAYDSPESQLRTKVLSGLPFLSDTPHTSSYNSPPQTTTATLPPPTPQSSDHHEPLSSFVQMLPPPHFAYEVQPAPESRKRSRSGSEEPSGREMNRNPGPPQILQPMPIETPLPAPEPSDMLFSIHGDPSTTHPPPSHGFASPISLPLPQQHHHHRLPPQAMLHSGLPGFSSDASPLAIGPPSVVGQPGMPDPAPRPRGPKLKFTPDEDALLVDLKEDKNLTWKQIADFFPGRTSGTLQVRYCTKLKAKDVVWTDEMVQRLQRAVEEYENDRWRIIAGKVGNGFTPAACRERVSHFGS